MVMNSVNRWTHIAVVFDNLSQKTNIPMYKTEITVYMNGVFLDKITTSRFIQVCISIFWTSSLHFYINSYGLGKSAYSRWL